LCFITRALATGGSYYLFECSYLALRRGGS
jgi:hypothetical protein